MLFIQAKRYSTFARTDAIITRRGKLLMPFLDKHGHYRVKFSMGKGSNKFTLRVEHVVLLAFKGQPVHKPYNIIHLDGNETNCELDNLKYAYPEHVPRLAKTLRESRLQRLRKWAITELVRERKGRKPWKKKDIAVLMGITVAAVEAMRNTSNG